MRRKPTAQAGFSTASLSIFLVVAMYVTGCMWVVEIYRHERAEVSASQYESLRLLASKSCAGESHLKQVVAAGPITNNQTDDLEEKLEAFASAQKMARTKARILDTKVECGSVAA